MYYDHNKSPKKTRNQMNVPYYILVNDEDKEHIKYYHDYLYGRTPYESEWGNRSAANAVILKGGIYSFIGPRRMKYMETAIKFRNKIAKERNIPYYNLKIVRVTKCNASTFKRIKNGELTEINFESVWE